MFRILSLKSRQWFIPNNFSYYYCYYCYYSSQILPDRAGSQRILSVNVTSFWLWQFLVLQTFTDSGEKSTVSFFRLKMEAVGFPEISVNIHGVTSQKTAIFVVVVRISNFAALSWVVGYVRLHKNTLIEQTNVHAEATNLFKFSQHFMK